jgi:tRNA pseudouridine38-40 synthase
MRYAVKVAYDGSFFHGSQRQGDDDRDSVEGLIARTLKEVSPTTKWDRWPITFSSRTDAGVSALGNVFTVETDMEPDDLLRALNANMENIWCWGHGMPRPEQNIRWANNRWYRYHLAPGSLKVDDLPKVNDLLSKFVGEQDRSNFCRMEEEKNPVTIIESAQAMDLSGHGELVVMDIVGSRFLWQQVRRTVGAVMDVMKGDLTMEDIVLLLNGPGDEAAGIRDRITTMPPIGLVLMDVRFKDIEFNVSRNALDIALKRSSEASWKASMKVLINTALKSLTMV